ncbi:Activating signal cointegrator 1 complex subunit 1 [Gryllus bimaculatus]|nr:Activating signal cointegrator 1 complex subunit 1 [Gryllus bimaculatus]
MEVLKPELMWIEGRCYRINHCIDRSSDAAYVEEEYQPDYLDCDNDEPCEDFEVESLEGGRFKTSFHIARAYFPCIIGSKGNTRRRLENETKTQVKVPKPGQDGDIVVIGNDRRSVCAARRRINIIVMSSRQKQSFTHFLSIPVNSRAIQQGFLEFKEKVLENCRGRGLDSSIFQSPEKLHLTLGTMVLADNEERKSAAEVLHMCQEAVIEPILGSKPLRLRMCGVEYMNDDPREVDVLYGKVEVTDGTQILQDLADGVVDFFANHADGLMEKQYDSVKLHVTLMNTLFREDKGGVSEQETSRRKHKPRESFDATEILQSFADYNFGEEEVHSIHLSQRYTTAENGYYQASVVLSLY